MDNFKQETIKDIVERINSKEILLPSMQRKFVWEEKQIIKLFDSIMRGFPFGDFIFWNIQTKKDINEYKFYEFIRDYSEWDNTINKPAGTIAKSEVDIVMDGQQRLTALYMGINGSITRKIKHKPAKNIENYKQKSLYFKPHLTGDERSDYNDKYKFAFLESNWVNEWNIQNASENRYYKLSDFYNMTKSELREYLGIGKITENEDSWVFWLEMLRYRLNDQKILNYHIIDTNTSITDVLEIFVRINSGGKILSKADLLFSTIITSWEKGREEMDSLIDQINKERVIHLRIDTLILACVYILNKPSSLKLETLDNETVKDIENNWTKIKNAVFRTKNFLKDNNFSDERIISYNAIIPIIYYFYYADTMKKEVEEAFVKYFCISQVFGLFGGASANTLDRVRANMCINKKLGMINKDFTLSDLYDINLTGNRDNAFEMTKRKLEKLIDDTKYGMSNKAYLVLCLLYPRIKLNLDDFDMDHIYPKAEFRRLFKNLTNEETRQYEAMLNGIPNLQLLDYIQNRGKKRDLSIHDWIIAGNHVKYDPYEGCEDKEIYNIKTLEQFKDFYDKRRELILDYLYATFDCK